MNEKDIQGLKDWFRAYSARFHMENPGEQKNIALKVAHTLKVVEDAALIAKGEGIFGEDLLIVQAAALLHDIGRFSQYAEFRTFRDSVSVNHGELGAEVLEREGVLRGLPDGQRRLILTAVKYHNAYSIPPHLEDRETFFLKLLRDADKLDIWRVFMEYFEEDREERAEAAGLGLPEEGGISPEIIGSVFRNQVVPLSEVRTLDEFKMLQLSWIFGLNFLTSYRLFSERGLLERLASKLPPAEDVREAVVHIGNFLKAKLRG
ncbi:MAG: HD domain-containing protein [Nitrospiraceae bacterium]|nr:HD domain-containing protein [Nitrospiraceae bacterium]